MNEQLWNTYHLVLLPRKQDENTGQLRDERKQESQREKTSVWLIWISGVKMDESDANTSMSTLKMVRFPSELQLASWEKLGQESLGVNTISANPDSREKITWQCLGQQLRTGCWQKENAACHCCHLYARLQPTANSSMHTWKGALGCGQLGWAGNVVKIVLKTSLKKIGQWAK